MGILTFWRLLTMPVERRIVPTHSVLESVAQNLWDYREMKKSNWQKRSCRLVENGGQLRQNHLRKCIIGDEVGVTEESGRGRRAICDSAGDIGLFPGEVFELLDRDDSRAFVANITVNEQGLQAVTVEIFWPPRALAEEATHVN